MTDKKYFITSESDQRDLLSNQVEIYHGLQKRATTLLRLIVAILAVSATLVSAIISQVVGGNIGIKSAPYYLNQTVSAARNSGDVSVAVILLFIEGFIISSVAIFIGIYGIGSVLEVLTSNGLHPFVPHHTEKGELVSVGEDNVSKSATATITYNSQILSSMSSSLKEGYTALVGSVVALSIGLLCSVLAYFAQLEEIQLIATALLGVSITYIISEIITSNVEYRAEKTKERIETVDKILSKVNKTAIAVATLFLIILPLASILFLLDATLYLIAATLGVLSLSLLIHLPLIHSEYAEDNIDIPIIGED